MKALILLLARVFRVQLRNVSPAKTTASRIWNVLAAIQFHNKQGFLQCVCLARCDKFFMQDSTYDDVRDELEGLVKWSDLESNV